MSSTQPLVSVIIPSWNRKTELRVCLDSIARQSGSTCEVIVADDGSTDGTVECLRNEYSWVKLISDHLSRVGSGYRRNQAIRNAAGIYILSVDSDSILQDNCVVERLVQAMMSRSDAGLTGGEIPVHLRMLDQASGIRFTRSVYPQRLLVRRADGLRQCDYLPTCFCMFRRSDALAVGGFDPYYEFGCDDGDFGLRLVRQLGRVNRVGFEVAGHHNASPGGRREDESYRYCMARLRLIVKLMGSFRFIAQFCWDMSVLGVRAIKPSNSEPTSGGGRGATVARSYIKSYIETMKTVKAIRMDRTRNFLSDHEMNRFVEWKMKGR